ncbi:MAG TPA: sensor histidine kinase [Longimicrobiales bacterium]|nr:sensor histidine kinase [Longimicrobiales bacterium]
MTGESTAARSFVSRQWLVVAVLVGATLLSLIDASQIQYDRALRGEPITWLHALAHAVPAWFAWAALTPVVTGMTARIHRLGAPAVRVAIHALAGITIVCVHVAVVGLVSRLVHVGFVSLSDITPAFLKYAGLTFPGGLVVYALLAGGWYAARFQAGYREREQAARLLKLQAAELEALVAQSQLRYLQAQLQPHFLFNSLHALSALVLKGDTTRAVRMTARLGELLRQALLASESSEITLDEEVRLLESYFAVQMLRFEDRLSTHIEIDEAARVALVPPLLLQPIVENAVVHAIEADPPGTSIEVRACVTRDMLIITIKDDGPGIANAAGEGVGLGNTRARLKNLHGDAATLDIAGRNGRGTRVRIELPYRAST